MCTGEPGLWPIATAPKATPRHETRASRALASRVAPGPGRGGGSGPDAGPPRPGLRGTSSPPPRPGPKKVCVAMGPGRHEVLFP